MLLDSRVLKKMLLCYGVSKSIIKMNHSLYSIINSNNRLSSYHNILYCFRCAREDNVQACRILLSYNIDQSIVSLQGYLAAQVATENVLKILQGTYCKLINTV